jgi:hypothetical protein
MSGFEEDFGWQMTHLPLVIAILGELPNRLFGGAPMVAPLARDIKDNADLMIVPFGGKDIAVRLRRPNKGYFLAYGHQFTIRSERHTGAETELSKIQRGLGDWFFYGHIEEGWLP